MRSRVLLRVCSAVCVSLAAGCGSSGPPAAAPPTAAQRLDLAIVGIEARIGDGGSRGSGFVLDGDRGLVLTTAHTVWGARSLKVATALGVLHGRIVARAPCDDLAVLQIEPRIPGLMSLPGAVRAQPAPGQLLRSVGRRRVSAEAGPSAMASIPVRAGQGLRAAAVDPALPPQPAAIPLDFPLVPEVSGGPVLDAAGRLVGMAESPGGRAVPWTAIRRRLDELRPGPRSDYVGWAGQHRCVARQHAYARAAHPGFRAGDARLNAPVPATRLPGTEGLDG